MLCYLLDSAQCYLLQFITINNIAAAANLIPLRQITRKIDSETVMQFQLLPKNGTWESIYKSNDTNNKFNPFLYSFLNIYEASFPTKHRRNKKWMDNTRNKNILQTQDVSTYPH
jgi:hypothetical protein